MNVVVAAAAAVAVVNILLHSAGYQNTILLAN
jgi:hypothetical protein